MKRMRKRGWHYEFGMKKRIIYIALFSGLILIFLTSAFKLGTYFWEFYLETKSQQKINDIFAKVDPSEIETLDDEALINHKFLAYQEFNEINDEFIGWLRIDDTVIDYPIVQTKNNTYYLTHNFFKEYSKYGTLFVDSNCYLDDPCENIIIYGHHMHDGKMFGSLKKYLSQDFFLEHQIITFDTMYEFSQYQIISVFLTSIHETLVDDLHYYDFIGFNIEEQYSLFVNAIKRDSVIDTEATALFGEQLLTLSTCEYSSQGGRLVLVAKKISSQRVQNNE